MPAWRAAAVILVAAAASSPVSACTLEAVVNGGFTVSHPGSLDVAVSVAKARQDGLLPPAPSKSPPNDVLLRSMIADMRRMQLRLGRGRTAIEQGSAASFSLVLVGPGLWSHFHQSSGGLLARYHVKGPLAGGVVVLTHHAVLEALLRGTLSAEAAVKRGLIAFAGSDTDPVRRLFKTGFGGKA